MNVCHYIDRNVKVSTPQPPWPTSLLLSPSQWKKSFLMFRWNLLWFSLCPSPLILSRGTAEGSLTLYFNMCFSGIWACWWDSPWIFSSVGWMLPVLSAFPPVICAAEPWSLSPVCLCRGGPELDAALQMCSCRCWVEGKDHLLLPPGATAPNAVQAITVHHGVHCLPLFMLVSVGLQVWPVELVPSRSVPNGPDMFSELVSSRSLPMCGASHFPVVNYVGLLAACQGPQGWHHDPLVPPVLPVCVISKLTEVTLGPVIQIIKDGVDQYWIEPTIDCWGALPATVLHPQSVLSEPHLLFGMKCLKAPSKFVIYEVKTLYSLTSQGCFGSADSTPKLLPHCKRVMEEDRKIWIISLRQ